MGRYYDDKISLSGLDKLNPFFKALERAAKAVDDAEDDWYERRREVFDELDFGDFNKSDGDVEKKYSQLKPGLSVYDFKSTFDNVDPDRRTASGEIRLVHDTFPTSGINSGFSDQIFVEEEDDEGDTVFVVADNVLAYQVDRGKGNIDTLYDGLAAFKTSSTSDSEFFEFIDDDDPGYFEANNVFKGFGQVPLAWESVTGYSSQQLQVMNAAGNDYDAEVGPKIQEYKDALAQYEGAGGGPLDSKVYKGVKAGDFVVGVSYQIKEVGTTNFTLVGAANNNKGTIFIATGAGSGTGKATAALFPFQDFKGTKTSYNRPGSLPNVLIKEARGFGS
jgi:hypothetical protein